MYSPTSLSLTSVVLRLEHATTKLGRSDPTAKSVAKYILESLRKIHDMLHSLEQSERLALPGASVYANKNVFGEMLFTLSTCIMDRHEAERFCFD